MWPSFAFALFPELPEGLRQGHRTFRQAADHFTEPQPQPSLPAKPVPDRFGVYTVGGEILPPKLVYSEPAVYSERMRETDAWGTVLVTSILGPDGIPSGTDVVVPFARPFDVAAVNAANQMRFEPAILYKTPVPVRIFVEVEFAGVNRPALPSVIPSGIPVEPPVALNAVHIRYPRKARKQRISGTVILSFIATREGLPSDLELIRRVSRELDETALRAVRLFRFRPAMMRGQPVPSHITADVTFRLYY
jgi:TonB family protein